MNNALGSAARRELAVVLGLAAVGVALVVLVAFAPWYEPVMAFTSGISVADTMPPSAETVPADVSAVVLRGVR